MRDEQSHGLIVERNIDAYYDRGGSFRPKRFLNDGAP